MAWIRACGGSIGKTKGVLYENGALTDLGNELIASMVTTKTLMPGEYAATQETKFNAISLNKKINVEVYYTLKGKLYKASGTYYGENYVKLNDLIIGTQLKDESSLSSAETFNNVDLITAVLGCSNANSIPYNYVTLTITKIVSV